MTRRSQAAAVLALLTLSLSPAIALADGDPASDALIGQSAYLPSDAGVTQSQQAALLSVLRTATDRGYPVRVAVVSSPADLGSISALWRAPHPYAQFLGTELSLAFRGAVLVVMPDGFGLYRVSGVSVAEHAALTRLAAPGPRTLVPAAITAVEALATAAGHPIPAAVISGASSPTGSTGGGDIVAVLVFAAGALLVAAAWTASFRARPPRLRRRAVDSAPQSR